MKTNRLFLLVGLLPFFIAACSTGNRQSSATPLNVLPGKPSLVLKGVASWYGHPFHGRKTANGERYNMYEYTAAHKSLPFGSRLLVVNPVNNKSIIVRVNDRGPYIPGRIIDLSYVAAKDLGILGPGTGQVWIEVYPPEPEKVMALAGWKKTRKSPVGAYATPHDV